MTNFWARTITGLSMVFILLATMAINYWFFAAAFLLVTILGLWEFYSLLSSKSSHPQKIFGTVAGALIYIVITLADFIPIFSDLPSHTHIPYLIFIVLFFLPFIFEIYRKKPHPMINVALTITGIIYIAVPLALLNLLNGPDAYRIWHFPVILVGFFLLTWFYDTGAYLYGKQFGKHKFFERVSPKKTWEGIVAGTIIALATAVGLNYLAPEIQLVDWFVMAILIAVFGTFGDLIESLFKRSLRIKDSGSILPGHGGILDRFDAIFLSVPFVFLYLFLRNLI